MMKTLLETDFINYYNRHKDLTLTTAIEQQTTTEPYFELNDGAEMICDRNEGVAKYTNNNRKEVCVINYETFVTPLPPRIKNTHCLGENICDLIVYSEEHFLLNELTDTNPDYIHKKRLKAQSQLSHSLSKLLAVDSINKFAYRRAEKRCCFFSKQTKGSSLGEINAPASFNRMNKIASNGFRHANEEIENLGFEYWEFYSSQTYII